jgi:Tol biopolymer transport system component
MPSNAQISGQEAVRTLPESGGTRTAWTSMSDTHTDGSYPQVQAGETGRLNSWKKIAAHFNRDVKTVQRWEHREGMPVHRHVHDKQGSVYAFRSELDIWWQSRRGKLPDSGDRARESLSEPPPAHSPPVSPTAPPTPETAVAPDAQATRFMRLIKRPSALAATIVAVLLLIYAVLKFGYPAENTWRNPLANATFTRLTDWPGIEQAAEISPDGRWVSFLADHDGHMDVWLTQIGSGSYRNLTRGNRMELVNPLIRTLGFSADGSLVTVWTRSSDGSHPEDIKLMAAPTAEGELRDFLPGVAEVAWSHDGRQIVYHTTAPGDPLFVRDARGVTHQVYVAPSGVHCHFPLWSKDDAYIYFARGIPPDDWDIWRIHPSGAGLERITFHDSQVSHPVLLDERTLVYLASDAQGSGPWLYALNVEHRVPHRISVGLERYTSLAASAGGTRLVATVDDSNSSIWSVPLSPDSGTSGDQRATQPVSLVSATGLSPRTGPNYILYVSARAGRQGIWKAADGQSRELWSDAHAIIVGGPAVARDGQHIAFTVADGERTILYAMNSDGGEVRALTRSLDLRGNPAWSPDGRSIVSAVLRDGEPRLMSIFLDNGPPSPLVSEYSIDPVWSPDGQFMIYSGADVGTTFALRAVARDGRPYPIPALILTRGARRVAFSPDARSIVLLRGEVGHKNFWRVDLRTGVERQITELTPDIAISDFDVSGDGSVILFDRIQENSRIALIERGG